MHGRPRARKIRVSALLSGPAVRRAAPIRRWRSLLCSRGVSAIHALLSAVFIGVCTHGCGGGSVGTGTGEGVATFAGTVVSRDGAPVAGVTVSIADSGEAVVTDENGSFSLTVPDDLVEAEVQLQLSSTVVQEPDSTAPADELSEQTLEVVLTEAPVPVEVRTVEVSVRIAGACAESFSNDRSIVQSLPIPEGAVCSLEVEVTDSGVPRSDLQFALEYRACADDAPWNPLLIGVTTSIDAPAVGSAEFPFTANGERCVYRVIAPFEAPELSPVIFEITTLFKQGYDAAAVSGGSPPAAETPDGTEAAPAAVPEEVPAEAPPAAEAAARDRTGRR